MGGWQWRQLGEASSAASVEGAREGLGAREGRAVKGALVCGRGPRTDVCDFGARLGQVATTGKSTEGRKWSSKKMLEIRPLEVLERSRKC